MRSEKYDYILFFVLEGKTLIKGKKKKKKEKRKKKKEKRKRETSFGSCGIKHGWGGIGSEKYVYYTYSCM